MHSQYLYYLFCVKICYIITETNNHILVLCNFEHSPIMYIK